MRDLSFVAMGRRCRDETPPPYWRIFLSSMRTEGVWSHRPCLTFVAMDRRCPIKTPPPTGERPISSIVLSSTRTDGLSPTGRV